MATQFYELENNARTTLASAYVAGSGVMVVADGSKLSSAGPFRLTAHLGEGRSTVELSMVVVASRSGNTLTVSGPVSGHDDVDLPAGTKVAQFVTKEAFEDIHGAANANEDAIDALDGRVEAIEQDGVPGLSTAVPAGQLWYGDGTGTPAGLPIGDGLGIDGSGNFVATGGVTAREVAALDLRRALAWDDFARSGALGGSTAPSGQAWSSPSGSHATDPDGYAEATHATASPVGISVVDVGTDRVEASVTVRTFSVDRPSGLTLCYVDTDNYLRVTVRNVRLFIIQRVGGTETQLASITIDDVASTSWRRVWASVHRSGTSLVVSATVGRRAQSSVTISGTDAAALMAGAGCGLWSEPGGARFSGFIAWASHLD